MTVKPINVIRSHIVIANGEDVYEAPVIDNALLMTLNIALHKRHKIALGIDPSKTAYIRVLVAKPSGGTDLDRLADTTGFDPANPPYDVVLKES